jgi:hypothetical protein
MIQQINPGPTIAQAFGKGLLETYQPMIQKELARQQTARAIGDIRNRPQGSPADTLYNLIEASSLSPEIGRSLGPLYQTLLQQQAASSAPQALSSAAGQYGQIGSEGRAPVQVQQAGTNAPGFKPAQQLSPEATAQQLAQQKTGDQLQNLSNQFLKQTRPDLFQQSPFGNIPTFDIATKSALRPNEEADLRRQMNSQGILPEQQEQVIQKINADIGNRYKEALQNYDIAQGQQRAVDQKWNTIKNDAPIQLRPFINNFGPKTQQILQDKYFQYAASQPINQTPEAVESQAMTLLQRDLNQLNALKVLPAMPPIRNWGDAKSYMDSTKRAYAPLKGQGWDQALLEDAIDNKDMGIEEAHEAIYGDQTNKKFLNDLSSVKKGKDDAQYVNRIADKLKNLGPNDDLVLARAMVLGSGGDLSDFINALDKASQEGLELSPFQQSQLQEVQIPRQQPLWEIFSNQPNPWFMGAGGVPGAIFGHFFNYLRGKK